MTNLDHILAENQAPSPRGDLSARILSAAALAEPANDDRSARPWWAIGGIAAMAVMAVMFVIQPSNSVETEWDLIADASGFSELYEWVEGDETS